MTMRAKDWETAAAEMSAERAAHHRDMQAEYERDLEIRRAALAAEGKRK